MADNERAAVVPHSESLDGAIVVACFGSSVLADSARTLIVDLNPILLHWTVTSMVAWAAMPSAGAVD